MNILRLSTLSLTLAIAVFALGHANPSFAAQTVHLTLEIAGNQIEGESTIRSLDREGTIECSSFTWGVLTPTDDSTGSVTGNRQYQPVTVTKRIDKSTPLLAKALAQNEPVTTAEFRFYRPDTTGKGAEEHFYTILLENGYIKSISAVSEVSLLGGPDAPPMMETVGFVFRNITWTYEIGGVTYQDSWTSR